MRKLSIILAALFLVACSTKQTKPVAFETADVQLECVDGVVAFVGANKIPHLLKDDNGNVIRCVRTPAKDLYRWPRDRIQ